jgi:hypothetical protein
MEGGTCAGVAGLGLRTVGALREAEGDMAG